MANKLPVGAVAPQEIITDLFDRRLFEISFAGAFNNTQGVLKHLAEQGLKGVEVIELEDIFNSASHDAYKTLLDNPEVRQERDKWYVDLYTTGFKRLFGNRASNRQSELRTTHGRYDTHPIPVPVYVGELPSVLDDDATRDALQSRLDFLYGEHGVLAGPPPVVMALYEDMAVSLRPSSRTLIQGKTEVWQLETRTDLRGLATASMAA